MASFCAGLLLCAAAAAVFGDLVALRVEAQSPVTTDDPAFDPIVAELQTRLTGQANRGKRALWVRLAWHTSGTFDKNRNPATQYRFGSFGGTMKFASEQSDPDNAGLSAAVTELQQVQAIYPWISSGDLFTLAGSVAIGVAGGPQNIQIAWTSGRCDAPSATYVPPVGNLPAAYKSGDTPDAWPTTMAGVDAVFTRLGFTAQETVALIGAHSLGGAHASNSGFRGPWTATPEQLTNAFFTGLKNKVWTLDTNVPANPQYTNGGVPGPTNPSATMMLPSDFGMLNYSSYYTHVDRYSTVAQSVFLGEFKAAWEKLITLGKNDSFALTTFTNCTVIPDTTGGSTSSTGGTSSPAPKAGDSSSATLLLPVETIVGLSVGGLVLTIIIIVAGSYISLRDRERRSAHVEDLTTT